MAPRLTWSRLLPGIITIVVLVVSTIAVLAYSSMGRVSGETVRLYVVTNSARGVMRGTEVWVAGQKVGVVEDVSFRPVSSDTTSRVVIAMDVREEDAAQIRHDSDVRVRAGANLIGPIVVYISAGTPRSAAARDGDTLVASRQPDAQDALRRLGDATKELGPLMNDARTVMSHVRDPSGTVGAFVRSGTGPEMAELRANVSALRDQFSGSSASRTSVMTSARSAMARVDSIRLLLRSGDNSLGRFRRDSSLARTIASVRDEIAVLRARMNENRGTLGRFAADSAIQLALASAQSELALLIEDMRKRPLRYIAF
jgi:phospholipid/cholesterol/gamma-HCH transport system substrate-binding protein